MHVKPAQLPAAHTANGFGLSLVGLAGTASATVAVLLMWTLLTAPTDVAVAVTEGPAKVAGLLMRVLVDAVRQLLSWL